MPSYPCLQLFFETLSKCRAILLAFATGARWD